jgi:signal transduction histidine kinase
VIRSNLNLTVKDDGKGMETDWSLNPSHFGLMNMERRARRLGGVMEIESQPEMGTSVQVIIPLK